MAQDKNSQTEVSINAADWVDRHGDFLYRYAFSRVHDATLAQDLVQETLLSALKNINSFRRGSSERTWITTILRNKIIDHYRRSAVTERIFDEGAAIEPELEDDFQKSGMFKGHWIKERGPQEWGDHPEMALQQKEFRQILQQCLSLLTEKLAGVFVLREIENMSSEEICKEFEISTSNLWVMLHRARTQLRKCLEKNWFQNV